MAPSDKGRIAELEQDSVFPERILGSKTGWLVGRNHAGELLVDFQGNPSGPMAARLAVALDSLSLREALLARRGVVLLFEEGDPRRPLLMALLHEPSTSPLLESMLEQPRLPLSVAAHVDGKRVVLEGKDEIVLQCGEASITLRRNGRVVIRGTQIESHARGRNRIRGGAVEIN